MNTSAEIDEREVLLRCQRGDSRAFGNIVEKYMTRAYYTALGLTGSQEDALDISQEAFVRAYRNIKTFDVSHKFFTWYYRILRNLCANFLRSRSRRARRFSRTGTAELEKVIDASADPSLLIERDEIKVAVWQAISSLSEVSREIIVLKEFQELSYKEIAELLGCPIGTVMSRLFNARQALKVKLEDFWP